MPDLSEILQLRPFACTVCGVPVQFARPTLADLCEAVHMNEKEPAEAKAWLLVRHLRDTEGKPVFGTIAEAMNAPARFSADCINQIERLYNEGSD